jgi:hypothetical protein
MKLSEATTFIPVFIEYEMKEGIRAVLRNSRLKRKLWTPIEIQRLTKRSHFVTNISICFTFQPKTKILISAKRIYFYQLCQITPWLYSLDRTVSTERPPIFCEVSTNSLRIERYCVVRAANPLLPQSRFSRPDPLLFIPSSCSVVLSKPSGPRSRPTTF